MTPAADLIAQQRQEHGRITCRPGGHAPDLATGTPRGPRCGFPWSALASGSAQRCRRRQTGCHPRNSGTCGF